jgi:hypothetical protein
MDLAQLSAIDKYRLEMIGFGQIEILYSLARWQGFILIVTKPSIVVMVNVISSLFHGRII